MAEATAREQLILELMNRARMDPAGEAARFGISLNKDLAGGHHFQLRQSRCWR